MLPRRLTSVSAMRSKHDAHHHHHHAEAETSASASSASASSVIPLTMVQSRIYRKILDMSPKMAPTDARELARSFDTIEEFCEWVETKIANAEAAEQKRKDKRMKKKKNMQNGDDDDHRDGKKKRRGLFQMLFHFFCWRSS